MPHPPTMAWFILGQLWSDHLKTNKWNDTLYFKLDSVSLPFLTLGFVWVFWTRERSSYLSAELQHKGIRRANHSPWETNSAYSRDRETGITSSILTVRKFFKGPHPSYWGYQANLVFPQLSGLPLKNLWTSSWSQGKLCPQHPFLRSVCSGICHISFSRKWREARILSHFSFISFATSQVIAFQHPVWSTFEFHGECLGDLSFSESSWNLIFFQLCFRKELEIRPLKVMPSNEGLE